MQTFRSVPVEELAVWLESHGAERLWSADGEWVLGGMISMPGTGEDLAEALRKVGGSVTLVGDGELGADAPVEAFMFDDAGARTFALTWSPGETDEVWLLSEDLLAQDALDRANQLAAAS